MSGAQVTTDFSVLGSRFLLKVAFFLSITLLYLPWYNFNCILLVAAASPPKDNTAEDVPDVLQFSIDLTEELTSDSKSTLHNNFR